MVGIVLVIGVAQAVHIMDTCVYINIYIAHVKTCACICADVLVSKPK